MKSRILISIDLNTNTIELGGYQGPRPNEIEISVVRPVPTRSKDSINLRWDLDLEMEVVMYDIREFDDGEVATFPPG